MHEAKVLEKKRGRLSKDAEEQHLRLQDGEAVRAARGEIGKHVGEEKPVKKPRKRGRGRNDDAANASFTEALAANMQQTQAVKKGIAALTAAKQQAIQAKALQIPLDAEAERERGVREDERLSRELALKETAAAAASAAAANSSTLDDFTKFSGMLTKMQSTLPDHVATKRLEAKVAQLALKMMEE